ncbi:MAG: putative toxin-antitoxin system toxin component, PIN family [Candidatus Hydrogenedentes bacterium]|nr:putative toxin-antitoxin system toxin component, PIN family [Candidatus Hydrogenedentota bacterium]
MRVVIDTNVLVSGLLWPYSPSGEIVRMLSSGALEPCYDARIMSEYEEVLRRPKFGFDPEKVDVLLDFIRGEGHLCAGQPLSRHLPDPDDEPFLEVAIAGHAAFLITGNSSHFPVGSCHGAKVTTPRRFVDWWRNLSRESGP